MDKNAERPYRALVVDDDANLRELVRLSLAREDIRCDLAEDGIVAENLLRQRQFDIVITDLRMPRKHGHELIIDLLAKPRHPMIFVVTGVVEPRLVGDLFARGVTDVMFKPIDYAVFAVKVRALLDRQKAVTGTVADHGSAAVVGQLDLASSALQAQLSQITDSFNATISNLTSQKEELEASFLSSVRMFTNLISESGHAEESHAGRVERMTMAICEETALTGPDKHVLGVAALLHDIGQFGMPDTIRNRAPWQMGPDDRAIYCRYPIIGAALMSEMQGATKIAQLIEQHAENYDGSGFPWGMGGEIVSLGARIIRIADGADTFMLHASRDNVIDQVSNHLREQRGKAYDPELVPLALDYLADYWRANQEVRTVRMAADALRPGMQLAENLYDSDGHFLARKGATLSMGMISHVRSLIGNQEVTVIEPESPKADNQTATSRTA
ncbi:MAG: response regulator [Candidatus Hydrogenedentes bacterium]|nr:response regulator [Candidatus Hydrogenedentota bacterium]